MEICHQEKLTKLLPLPPLSLSPSFFLKFTSWGPTLPKSPAPTLFETLGIFQEFVGFHLDAISASSGPGLDGMHWNSVHSETSPYAIPPHPEVPGPPHCTFLGLLNVSHVVSS